MPGTPDPVHPVLRVARPTNRLAALEHFYCEGAGLSVLSRFSGNAGYSGLIVGGVKSPWHLALFERDGYSVPPVQETESLLVLYLPDPAIWRVNVDRMQASGYQPVPPQNPYWAEFGMTFEDPDGHRLVFQNRSWDL